MTSLFSAGSLNLEAIIAENMNAECLTFQPRYMERVWGGRKLQTLFNREIPSGNPIGESWELVDREDIQSIVSGAEFRGASLHELWVGHRHAIFGDGYEYPRFPILVKILDASDVVSVQVHPPARRTVADLDEPKTELWYFDAAEEGAGIYAGLKKGADKKAFELALASGEIAALLHWIPTQRDSFIFIPSGRLHAIGAGNVIFEIQQNSDTTYRVFDWNRLGLDGKPRAIHVEQSLRCIDFDDLEPALGKAEKETLIACDYFRVDRWSLDQARPANSEPKFAIFQVLTGEVSFGTRLFRHGDLFLVPAQSHTRPVTPHNGAATILRTTL
jgi:mannose-6-phosphate isomerase